MCTFCITMGGLYKNKAVSLGKQKKKNFCQIFWEKNKQTNKQKRLFPLKIIKFSPWQCEHSTDLFKWKQIIVFLETSLFCFSLAESESASGNRHQNVKIHKQALVSRTNLLHRSTATKHVCPQGTGEWQRAAAL